MSGMGRRSRVQVENWARTPSVDVSISLSSSSEISEVGGVVGHCGAELPDNDICSCCAAMSWVMALFLSGVLLGSWGRGDEGGDSFSLSSLDR